MPDRSPRPEGGTRPPAADNDLTARLSSRVVGQPAAWHSIVPYLQMYQAGLAPAARPAGIFLLLGPTGTGKTRTVEALAEVLHGDSRMLLKIDCGEYQSDHEVAKLIGAPPGYLGHRETTPMLTQERLRQVTSDSCGLSLVLFDEIEKAAPALGTLLLGILDKATLRLGDNTVVDFENSLVFLTSNLGGREMMREVQPGIGFQPDIPRDADEIGDKLESIALGAVRRRFSPEFVNRIDVIITYRPLDAASLAAILERHIVELQEHVHTRLADRSFDIEVSEAARALLLARGTSPEYGARELKRTIHRHLTQPLAALVAAGRIAPGSRVLVDAAGNGDELAIHSEEPETVAPPAAAALPTVLVVDDNASLLGWLKEVLVDAGFTPILAESVAQATELARDAHIDLAMLDLMLPDGDGVTLAVTLRKRADAPRVAIITGMELSPEEAAVCQRYDIPVLRKPFLGRDAVEMLRTGLRRPDARARRAG